MPGIYGDEECYYPIMRFYTDKNECITVEMKSSRQDATSLGKQFEVIYNPNNPHDFDTHPQFFLIKLPRILVVVGLAGIIIATLELLNIISIIPNFVNR